MLKMILIVLLLILLYHLIIKPKVIHVFIINNLKVAETTSGKVYAIIFLACTMGLLFLAT